LNLESISEIHRAGCDFCWWVSTHEQQQFVEKHHLHTKQISSPCIGSHRTWDWCLIGYIQILTSHAWLLFPHLCPASSQCKSQVTSPWV